MEAHHGQKVQYGSVAVIVIEQCAAAAITQK
jgi:hypothetical protein